MIRQRGMALLIVLLLIATFSVIAVNSQDTWKQLIWRTETQLSTQQARFILLGAEDLIRMKVIKEIPQDKVHAGQTWAQKNMHFQLDDDTVQYSITDENACFNLNTLVSPSARASGESLPDTPSWNQLVFLAMMENLGVDEVKATSLFNALQPMLPLADITELRAIEGINRELWLRFRPLICLNQNKKVRINVNSLYGLNGAILLRSLMINKISLAQTQEALQKRSDEGWAQADNIFSSFQQESAMEALSKMQSAITFTSDSFSASMLIESNGYRYELTSKMQRRNNNVVITKRHFGIVQ